MCGFCASKRKLLQALPALALPTLVLPALTGCSSNSALNRRQLMLVSDAQLAEMSQASWADVKKSQTLSNNPTLKASVSRVMSRLASVDPDGANQNWELAVFEDEAPNAWVLPGGQVGVNSGLFEVARTDGQLAAVLGHERGHVLAKHSAERVSQGLAAQLGQKALSAAVGMGYGENAGQIAAQAFGLSAKFGVLMPYGRRQEIEADKIGLRLMAKAGYDPNQSIAVWENMMKAGGSRPPEFLSTHPSPSTRIDELRAEIARL